MGRDARIRSWLARGCGERAILAVLAAALAATACAPRAMRGGPGTDNLQMDRPAMSTTLDRADVEYLVEESLSGLLQSRFWNGEVRTAPVPPVFAIWPVENATSEHVEDQMQMLLSSIETTLVNSGDVEVVARARQSALAREIGIQEGAAFDPMEAARFGRQLGAQYFVTGKLMAVDERLRKARRVQYSLFVQILEIETGLVKFQHETARSKALQR